MALPSPDPPPLATLQRAGDDLGGDLCQVFYRPGPGTARLSSGWVCPSFGCADRFEPSGRMSSLEQQLELYGGELAEAALATPAVVRAFDPVHDR